jgi:hypothetical protein
MQANLLLDDGWCAKIPPSVFSNRLAVVLNTHLKALLNVTVTVASADAVGTDWANMTGTWYEFTAAVYHVNTLWFAFYFISAIVMMICAITNVVLRSMIHVPDFLGSISALTRDSTFVDVSTPASWMDGTERTRLLRDKWIMIQDVRPEESVGKNTFSDDVANVGMRMDRKYL